MNNIDIVSNAVLLMDKQLREELLIKGGTVQIKKLWENTYIKKQIEKRENGGKFNVSDHIRAMVYSMLTSGASWNRLEPHIDIETGRILLVDKMFSQYDSDTLIKSNPSTLADRLKEYKLGTQFIDKQMQALVGTNIKKLLSLEKEYGSIDKFYQSQIGMDKSLKPLVRILSANGGKYKYAQMGEALIAEYLRNVGYDIAKPDRHIRRVLGSNILGCSDRKITPVYETFDIIAEIAKATKKHVAEVDYILWSYCANGYGEICTVKKPKCNYCVIVDYCKA